MNFGWKSDKYEVIASGVSRSGSTDINIGWMLGMLLSLSEEKYSHNISGISSAILKSNDLAFSYLLHKPKSEKKQQMNCFQKNYERPL